MLPIAYDLSGNDILAKGTKNIPANTPMDVDRYEKDLANVTSSGAVSSLNLSGIDAKFGNGTLYTWTLGLERKIANLTADLGYVGTVGQKLRASLSRMPIPALPLSSHPTRNSTPRAT